MPNYVTNIIEFTGDQETIDALFEFIKNDKFGLGTIDFEKIRPRPKELDIESGSLSMNGLKAYRDFMEVYCFDKERTLEEKLNVPKEKEDLFLEQRTDIDPEVFAFGRQAYHNLLKFGAPTWYEWDIENWGTKWNACGYYEDTDYSHHYNKLEFDTAWSAPHPIIEDLAEKFPTLMISHKWADEDIGNNCGEIVYDNGEERFVNIPETYKEGVDLATRILNLQPFDIGIMLNKTKTDYIPIWRDDYQVVMFDDKYLLFTNENLSFSDVPENMELYQIRTDDNDVRKTIERTVSVNNGGSLLSLEPLDLGTKGYIELTEENDLNFISGDSVSIEDYMDDRIPKIESQDEGMGAIT